MKSVPPASAVALMVYCLVIRVLPFALSNFGLQIDQRGYYPWEFTPLFAFSLFSVSLLADRRLGLALPVLMWALGDLAIGLAIGMNKGLQEGFMATIYPGQAVTYLSLAMVLCIGLGVRAWRNWLSVLCGALLAPTLHFVLTNYAAWQFDLSNMYTRDLAGLQQAYVNAIPFYRMGLASTLVYSAVFFSPMFINWLNGSAAERVAAGEVEKGTGARG